MTLLLCLCLHAVVFVVFVHCRPHTQTYSYGLWSPELGDYQRRTAVFREVPAEGTVWNHVRGATYQPESKASTAA